MSATNLFNLLYAPRTRKPDSPFLYHGGRTISYARALSATERLSGAFERRGLGRGDRVLIQLGNSPEFIYSFLALVRLGAVAVPVNPAARRYEMRGYIELSEPRALITTPTGSTTFATGIHHYSGKRGSAGRHGRRIRRTFRATGSIRYTGGAVNVRMTNRPPSSIRQP